MADGRTDINGFHLPIPLLENKPTNLLTYTDIDRGSGEMGPRTNLLWVLG